MVCCLCRLPAVPACCIAGSQLDSAGGSVVARHPGWAPVEDTAQAVMLMSCFCSAQFCLLIAEPCDAWFLVDCHRHEFKATSPLLLVAPQSVLDFWEGEWQFWACPAPKQATGQPSTSSHGPSAAAQQQGGSEGAGSCAGGEDNVNVVVYTGSAFARSCILEHEVWLHSASTDNKARGKVRQQWVLG